MNWKSSAKKVFGRLVYGFLGAVLATVLISTSLSFDPSAQKFAHILDIIQESYVDPAKVEDEGKLYETAVNSVLREIGDKHGRYLSPEQYLAMQKETSGEGMQYAGIGVEVSWYEEGDVRGLFVNDVFDGPARTAGIKVKDIITKVNGNTYDSLQEYINNIRGPATTFVTVFIRRGGNDLGELTIERHQARNQNVSSVLLPANVIYVKIKQFNQGTADDVESHVMSRIAELTELGEEPVGLIVDGRYNPGGLLTEAHLVTDLFIAIGKKTVITDGNLDEMDMEFIAERAPLFPKDFPIAMIINDYCASACEILAAATKRHRTIKLFGLPTYGKGSVQTIMPLSDGSAVKVTTAYYYAGGDVKVDGKPVTPDFNIGKADKTREEVVDHRLAINSHDITIDEQLAKAHWWILFANTIDPRWRYAESFRGPVL